MLYDVRLALHYDYEGFVHGDRHLIRVAPVSIPGRQRVIASALAIDPPPRTQETFVDFFGNQVTTIGYAGYHARLDVRLSARVAVDAPLPQADLSPDLEGLKRDLSLNFSLDRSSPHHFLAPSPRIARDDGITAYARQSLSRARTVWSIAMDFCRAIHADFAYDKGSTNVDTPPGDAFARRTGVCQDFAHIMIAGLRGLGIPSAYVSGFLRTTPPQGQPRLEGADAMHAWVRVWCGRDAGWIGFDPTNAIVAGDDHITIGHGRDYSDISPIVGVLRTSGRHGTRQAVDVVPVA